jgi:hypothetical protein
MLKKAAAFLIVVLALLDLAIIGTIIIPSNFAKAESLESDMPVVFIDPQNRTADPDDQIVISLRIFNLSANFRMTDDQWLPGDPFPGIGGRYNYSTGYLYGFTFQFSWDPTVLEYVDHTATVPEESYPGGILHDPGVITVEDNVTASEGKYRLSMQSQHPAAAFNLPGANATVFNMTFNVIKRGKSYLRIDQSDLVNDFVHLFTTFLQDEIPHWVRDGQFQTSELLTRIESVKAGAYFDDTFYDPVISGETTTIETTMVNDGALTDTYNLTLFDGTNEIAEWIDETLDAGENKSFTHEISNLGLGSHSFTAEAEILHGATTFSDEVSASITVVGIPSLVIQGPDTIKAGETLTFSASGSTHNDPNGQILWYKWSIWAPEETAPRESYNGNASAGEDTFKYKVPSAVTKFGNWTVLLIVEDSFGITAEPKTGQKLLPDGELMRTATAAYVKTKKLDVGEAGGLGFFNLENIALIVIVIIVIIALVLYLRRRSR